MSDPAAVLVRFLSDDPYGGWEAGELAEDLGWEQGIDPAHPDFVPVRLLRTEKHGELLSLTDPYGRGLIVKEA